MKNQKYFKFQIQAAIMRVNKIKMRLYKLNKIKKKM